MQFDLPHTLLSLSGRDDSLKSTADKRIYLESQLSRRRGESNDRFFSLGRDFKLFASLHPLLSVKALPKIIAHLKQVK